jgi:hypothetical protein
MRHTLLWPGSPTVTSSGGANRRREGNQDEGSMKVRFNYPHVIVL